MQRPTTLETVPTGRKAYRANIKLARWNGISLCKITSSEAWLISHSGPGFLSVSVQREDGVPTLIARHHGVDGEVLNEDRVVAK